MIFPPNNDPSRLLSRLVVASLLVSCVALAQPQAPKPLKGTVVEKVDAAGYSYLRVKADSGEEWAAVPQVEVAVGAAVTIEVQARMQNFESKTLKRSWPVIAFGTLTSGATAKPAAPTTPAAPAGMENPHEKGLPKTVSAPPVDGAVLERIDAGVYTYLRLKTKDGETWAAVPRADVQVGAQVRIRNAQPMDGFTSPTLKRTFERIVFGSLEVPAAAPVPAK